MSTENNQTLPVRDSSIYIETPYYKFTSEVYTFKKQTH